jgi:two-component system, OmpR family, KDP operon response regulator KdpE
MAGELLLVCDDDPHIRRTVGLLLRDAGFGVVSTATAGEALDAAAVQRPQLAIVDLMLGDHDGIELCRRLREWSAMPILVLSAIHDEQKKIEALHAGADDYVTKPFGPGELVARVQAALRRAGRDEGEPRVQAGRLTVDLAARAVYAEQQELHLTPIEFALLRALVLNRGMLMTHSQLLSEVWGPQYADATTVLRTHVANLRRKLRVADPEDRLIRTDPGVGYRFAA